jgi:hypothetical protein
VWTFTETAHAFMTEKPNPTVQSTSEKRPTARELFRQEIARNLPSVSRGGNRSRAARSFLIGTDKNIDLPIVQRCDLLEPHTQRMLWARTFSVGLTDQY